MIPRLSLLLVVSLLMQCTGPSSSPASSAVPYAGSSGRPEIINVSAYDPKERQRAGQSYSEHDVSALRANGAMGLIARAGKGGNLDTKCATFLASADRIGMLPGVYYRFQTHVDAVRQVDQFLSRAQSLAHSRAWNAPALLLCLDFDAHSRLSDLNRAIDRVVSRTGVYPVVYLENSTHMKLLLRAADPATRDKLKRCPYWLALYAHDSGASEAFPPPGHPSGLIRQYQVWSNWTFWQYGGVDWEGGRSRPKVYNHGSARFPLYFGNLDRPVERSVFNGSPGALAAFWAEHGLRLR